MIGAVDYGARGLDPSPDWNHYVVFSVMAHPSAVPLSTQTYK